MAFIGYDQVLCDGPAVQDVTALTVPARATGAEIQAQSDGDVNYTLDGTSPGASKGMILNSNNAPKEILIEDLNNIQFVKSDADTHLNVHYFAGRDV